jgi:hypothetical protein
VKNKLLKMGSLLIISYITSFYLFYLGGLYHYNYDAGLKTLSPSYKYAWCDYVYWPYWRVFHHKSKAIKEEDILDLEEESSILFFEKLEK